MPKKAKKTQKIAVLSDSDDEEDFKNPRKKGHKFAISDSDDDDLSLPKPSTSKGKIHIYSVKLQQSPPVCFHSRFHK